MNDKLTLEKLQQECMVGMKIYDMCRGQKCLVPSLKGNQDDGKTYIQPAKNGTDVNVEIYSSDGQSTTIAPNGIFDLTSLTEDITVSVVPNTQSTVIKSISINSSSYLNDGYWDVDVNFQIRYSLQFRYGVNDKLVKIIIDNGEVESVEAYSGYRTKVTLYGGKSGNGVVYSFGALPDITLEKPTHFIQAKSNILECKISELEEGTVGNIVSKKKVVCTTIGLFFIIALVRVVKYNNVSLEQCNIPEKCKNNSACKDFSELPFPFMDKKINLEVSNDKCNDKIKKQIIKEPVNINTPKINTDNKKIEKNYEDNNINNHINIDDKKIDELNKKIHKENSEENKIDIVKEDKENKEDNKDNKNLDLYDDKDLKESKDISFPFENIEDK